MTDIKFIKKADFDNLTKLTVSGVAGERIAPTVVGRYIAVPAAYEATEIVVGTEAGVTTDATFNPNPPVEGQDVELVPPTVAGSSPITIELKSLKIGVADISYTNSGGTILALGSSVSAGAMQAVWAVSGPLNSFDHAVTANVVTETADPNIVSFSKSSASKWLPGDPQKPVLVTAMSYRFKSESGGDGNILNRLWHMENDTAATHLITNNHNTLQFRPQYFDINGIEVVATNSVSERYVVAENALAQVVTVIDLNTRKQSAYMRFGTVGTLTKIATQTIPATVSHYAWGGYKFSIGADYQSGETSGFASWELDAIPAFLDDPAELDLGMFFSAEGHMLSQAAIVANMGGAQPTISTIHHVAQDYANLKNSGTNGPFEYASSTIADVAYAPPASGGGTVEPTDPALYTMMASDEHEMVAPKPRSRATSDDYGGQYWFNSYENSGSHTFDIESLFVGDDLTFSVVSGAGSFADPASGMLTVTDTSIFNEVVVEASNLAGNHSYNFCMDPKPASQVDPVEFHSLGDLRVSYDGAGNAIIRVIDPLVRALPAASPISRVAEYINDRGDVIGTIILNGKTATVPADGYKTVRVITTWSNGDGIDRTHTRINRIEPWKADWSLADLTVETDVVDTIVPAGVTLRLVAPSRRLQEIQCRWTFNKGGPWKSFSDANPFKEPGSTRSLNKQVGRIIYETGDFEWTCEVHWKGQWRVLTGTIGGFVDRASSYTDATTYYVSKNSDFPAGAINTFTDPITAAAAIPSTQTSLLLLHRDDVYDFADADQLNIGGFTHITVDAYGTGINPPRLNDVSVAEGAGSIITAVGAGLIKLGEIDLKSAGDHITGRGIDGRPYNRSGIRLVNNKPWDWPNMSTLMWGVRTQGFRCGVLLNNYGYSGEFLNYYVQGGVTKERDHSYQPDFRIKTAIVENLDGIDPAGHDCSDYLLYAGPIVNYHQNGTRCIHRAESHGGGEGKDYGNRHGNSRIVGVMHGSVQGIEGVSRFGWTAPGEGNGNPPPTPAHQTILRWHSSGCPSGSQTSVTDIWMEGGFGTVAFGSSSSNNVGRWGAHMLSNMIWTGNHNQRSCLGVAVSGCDVRNVLGIVSGAKTDMSGFKQYISSGTGLEKDDGGYGMHHNNYHDCLFVNLHADVPDKHIGFGTRSGGGPVVSHIYDMEEYHPASGLIAFEPFVKEKLRDHMSPGLKYNGLDPIDISWASPPDEIALYSPLAGSASSVLRPQTAENASVFDIFGNLRSDASVDFVGPLPPRSAPAV